jgi:hypothetical protein
VLPLLPWLQLRPLPSPLLLLRLPLLLLESAVQQHLLRFLRP